MKISDDLYLESRPNTQALLYDLSQKVLRGVGYDRGSVAVIYQAHVPDIHGPQPDKGTSWPPDRQCKLLSGAMQRAVPRQRSGPPAVSPVPASPSAFAALPGGGVAPVPIQPMKRGVGLLWAAVAEWGPGPLRAVQTFDFCAG